MMNVLWSSSTVPSALDRERCKQCFLFNPNLTRWCLWVTFENRCYVKRFSWFYVYFLFTSFWDSVRIIYLQFLGPISTRTCIYYDYSGLVFLSITLQRSSTRLTLTCVNSPFCPFISFISDIFVLIPFLR